MAMNECGCDSIKPEQSASSVQRRILIAVLLINLLMFGAELGAGIWADSQALIADSADNFGDALAYLLSLLVVGHSLRWRSTAAFAKGLLQLAFGVGVIISIAGSLLDEPQPTGKIMMAVAFLALGGNLLCFVLLLKHRNADINMRSIWLCSRNDIVNNAGVILAGALVMWLESYWPDIIVASLVALLFLHTSWTVMKESFRSWQDST